MLVLLSRILGFGEAHVSWVQTALGVVIVWAVRAPAVTTHLSNSLESPRRYSTNRMNALSSATPSGRSGRYSVSSGE
jgi:hypothetical protein